MATLPASPAAPTPLWQRLWPRRPAAPVCDDGDMGTAFGMELSLGATLPTPAQRRGAPARPWYARWGRRRG